MSDRGLPIPPEMMGDHYAPAMNLIYTHPLPSQNWHVIGMNFGGFPGRYICQNP